MILTLEVTGQQAQEMGTSHRKVFKAVGGTIGRLPDNDWVFPDPYVSGRHALIRYLDGRYFIEDTSTNGVFINSADSRLTRGQAQQLRDGDLLYIDAYKINVSIQNDPAADSRNDPFASLKALEDRTANFTSRQTEPRTSTLPSGLDEDGSEDEEDEDDDRATEWYGGVDMNEPKSSSSAFPPPDRANAPKPASVPAPRPQASRAPAPVKAVPAAPASDSSHLQALFDAAGIEGLTASRETAETLGHLLRAALNGVMEALRTRERMKDDLRLRGTTFKDADNNPLKFSANVDDAFHNLLVKHNPAYLAPVAAFEDAFRDVRDHQLALQTAMRLAFESTLSQFDPQRLQEEFDRQMKGMILGVPAKMRYWDLYRDKYGELIKDAEAGFRTLFGEAFGRAYEDHLERLKQPGHPGG